MINRFPSLIGGSPVKSKGRKRKVLYNPMSINVDNRKKQPIKSPSILTR